MRMKRGYEHIDLRFQGYLHMLDEGEYERSRGAHPAGPEVVQAERRGRDSRQRGTSSEPHSWDRHAWQQDR